MKITNLMIGVLDDGFAPNTQPILELAKTWGLAVLAFLAAIAAIVVAIKIVLLGFKFLKAEDANQRHEIKTQLIWTILGFFIAISGSVIMGVLSKSFFN